MYSISFTYTPEDELHGELSAKLRGPEFSGQGSAWFNLSEIQAFARSLGTYPIEPGSILQLQGGNWRDDRSIDQVHLGIKIRPVGSLGMLALTVQLARVAKSSTDIGGEVRVELPLTYSDLANFQSSLASHLDGRVAEAVLTRSSS